MVRLHQVIDVPGTCVCFKLIAATAFLYSPFRTPSGRKAYYWAESIGHFFYFFALDVFLLRDILNSPAKVGLRFAYPGSCRREYEIGSYLCPYAVYIRSIC